MPLPRPKVGFKEISLHPLNPPDPLENEVLERPVGPKAGGELPQKKLSPPETYENALLAGPAEELEDMSTARIQQSVSQMSRSDLREDFQLIMLHQQHALQETFAVEMEKLKSLLMVLTNHRYPERFTEQSDPSEMLHRCLTPSASGTSLVDDGNPGLEGERPVETSMDFSGAEGGPHAKFLPLHEPASVDGDMSKQTSHDNIAKVLESNARPTLRKGNTVQKFVDPQEPQSGLLVEVVASYRFIGAVSFLIFLNTVFIGYEVNEKITRALRDPNEKAPGIFHVINITFTVVFFLELVARLYALRWWFFFSEDWKWNVFDLFLVVSSIAQEGLESVNLTFVRVVRVFRIIRVARIIRVLRFFRELRHMVFTIIQSLASLSWAFLLLLLITYVFSIFVISGASEYIEAAGPADINSKVLQIYFGDLNAAMYSLIHAISGGEDWGPMATSLAEQSELYRMAFVAYIVFVVFGVLNVLTGVFCSTGSTILDKDLLIHQELLKQRQFVNEMLRIFKELDPDEDGHFTWDEFAHFMQDPNLHAYFNANDLDPSDARLLFQLLDHNNTKEVQTMDFIVGCFKLKGAAKSIHVMKMARDIESIGRQVSYLLQRSKAERHQSSNVTLMSRDIEQADLVSR